MAPPRTSRVSKRASSSSASTARTTRQRSRLSSGGSNSSALQSMVPGLTDSMESAHSRYSGNGTESGERMGSVREEQAGIAGADVKSQEYESASSQPRDKGKGRIIEAHQDEEKPFPIMELPTEIRLEIYRACLTRPHKILLSKVEKPPSSPVNIPPSDTGDALSDSEVDDSRAWFELCHSNARTSARRLTTDLQPPPRRSNRLHRTATSGSSLTMATAPAPAWVLSRPLPTSQPATNGTLIGSRGPRPARLKAKEAHDARLKNEDPLIVNILRTNKEIHKEARSILYSENVFDLDINTAVTSLAALHQRSRRHIKHIELEIPTYTEILERFSEVVRLSLRYCSGLKKFVIHTPFTLPGADATATTMNTTVYANGFDILRWLPQECQVILAGNTNPEIDLVVNKHLLLAKTQDKVRYAKQQLGEAHRLLLPGL